VKANRKNRKEQKIGEMPEEVRQAKILIKIGIGGRKHWEIIDNAIKKYPQWF